MRIKFEHKLIQSFVADTYMVSTAYRRSSASIIPELWYYETIVWEYNSKTKQRGKILEIHDSGINAKMAFRNHMTICETLLDVELSHVLI